VNCLSISVAQSNTRACVFSLYVSHHVFPFYLKWVCVGACVCVRTCVRARAQCVSVYVVTDTDTDIDIDTHIHTNIHAHTYPALISGVKAAR